MIKLQVKVPDELHTALKAEAKDSGKYFGTYVLELIERGRAKTPPKLKKMGIVVVDTETQEVMNHFEKQIAKIRSPRAAKIAAKQLIEEHGFDRVIGAINAVKQSQGMEFAPVIASLPTLQEKWVNLEHFVKRKLTKQRSVVFRPTVK